MHLLLFAEAIQLFPDGTLFIHVGLILLMIFVLNRTLYRPVNDIIERRDRNKGGHSSEADKILADVEARENRYNKEVLDARSEGYALIEKEQKKAIAAREKKLAQAKTETADKFNADKAGIDKRTADARVELAGEAEAMADKIAASILKG